MFFTILKRYLHTVQRAIVCGLFLTWSCLMLFPTAEGFIFAIFAALLLAAGVIDLESRRIPGVLCILLLIIGGFQLYFFIPDPVWHMLGAAAISALLLLTKFLFRTGLGGGDVKLLAASSLFLGWMPLLWGVFMGCLLALCAGVLAWLMHKKIYNCEMAFAPFLTIGILWIVLYNNF